MTMLESQATKTGLTTEGTSPAVVISEDGVSTREHVAAGRAFAVARISLGSVFLWAFADKLIGLDHSTPAAKAWLNGGSPSGGYLKGVAGPFAGVFNSIAGTPADILFMVGLLGIGLALTLGIGMRIAAASGTLLLVFMWAASLPIKTHPFIDDHLVYAVVLVGLALMHAGNTWGFGKIWNKLPIVSRFPFLR